VHLIPQQHSQNSNDWFVPTERPLVAQNMWQSIPMNPVAFWNGNKPHSTCCNNWLRRIVICIDMHRRPFIKCFLQAKTKSYKKINFWQTKCGPSRPKVVEQFNAWHGQKQSAQRIWPTKRPLPFVCASWPVQKQFNSIPMFKTIAPASEKI